MRRICEEAADYVERWLSLARVEVQTASGSSTAEMTLEGLLDFEAIRDYLYSRMRGARDHGQHLPHPQATAVPPGAADELAAILREVAAELRELRLTLGHRDARRGDA